MRYVIVAALLLIAGCAQQSQLNTVLGLQTAYSAGVTAEILYEKSGKADSAVLKTVEADRIQAYSALEPLVKAAEVDGSVITAAEMDAATVAVTALQTYEANHSIKPAGT